MSVPRRYRPAHGQTILYLTSPTVAAGVAALSLIFVLDAPAHSFLWVPVLAAFVVFAILIWLIKRRAEECQLIIELMFAEGQIELAAELFERETRWRHRPTHGIFVFNRAIAYIFQGEHQMALEIFETMRKDGAFEQALTQTLSTAEPVYRALAASLAGALDRADDALEEADHEDLEPLTILPQAIVWIRRDRAADALELLSRRWTDAEEMAGVFSLAALYLVRAFATRLAEPERELEVERLIDNLQPWDETLVGWVGTDWPEMREFCSAFSTEPDR